MHRDSCLRAKEVISLLNDIELHACRVSVDRQANVYMVVCVCRQLVGSLASPARIGKGAGDARLASGYV